MCDWKNQVSLELSILQQEYWNPFWKCKQLIHPWKFSWYQAKRNRRNLIPLRVFVSFHHSIFDFWWSIQNFDCFTFIIIHKKYVIYTIICNTPITNILSQLDHVEQARCTMVSFLGLPLIASWICMNCLYFTPHRKQEILIYYGIALAMLCMWFCIICENKTRQCILDTFVSLPDEQLYTVSASITQQWNRCVCTAHKQHPMKDCSKSTRRCYKIAIHHQATLVQDFHSRNSSGISVPKPPWDIKLPRHSYDFFLHTISVFFGVKCTHLWTWWRHKSKWGCESFFIQFNVLICLSVTSNTCDWTWTHWINGATFCILFNCKLIVMMMIIIVYGVDCRYLHVKIVN